MITLVMPTNTSKKNNPLAADYFPMFIRILKLIKSNLLCDVPILSPKNHFFHQQFCGKQYPRTCMKPIMITILMICLCYTIRGPIPNDINPPI